MSWQETSLAQITRETGQLTRVLCARLFESGPYSVPYVRREMTARGRRPLTPGFKMMGCDLNTAKIVIVTIRVKINAYTCEYSDVYTQ